MSVGGSCGAVAVVGQGWVGDRVRDRVREGLGLAMKTENHTNNGGGSENKAEIVTVKVSRKEEKRKKIYTKTRRKRI